MNPINMKPNLSPHCLAIAVAAVITSTLFAGAAEPQFSDVFIAGRDPFKSIRIPSVVVTKKGAVLAFAEGRAVAADQANNKLILKRSTDGGNTWGALQIIADDGENCLNNPCAVMDGKSGRVILMFQSYPSGFSERDGQILPGLDGPAIVRNYVIHSDDDGATWSKMEDVTRTTKHAERVTIMELRESMCRWPLGDPSTSEFRFCGGPSPIGTPYCTFHERIAYQPSTLRQREKKQYSHG